MYPKMGHSRNVPENVTFQECPPKRTFQECPQKRGIPGMSSNIENSRNVLIQGTFLECPIKVDIPEMKCWCRAMEGDKGHQVRGQRLNFKMFSYLYKLPYVIFKYLIYCIIPLYSYNLKLLKKESIFLNHKMLLNILLGEEKQSRTQTQ